MKKSNKAKVLIIDIETAPLVGYLWGIWDQTLGLNQIKSDWHLLSFAAKWLDETEVFYCDQRNVTNIEDDSKILKQIWNLMDQADVVIGQNSKKFDVKKLNARFILNGFGPPSHFKQIDTIQLAKKHFAFTSNKLEYMSTKLNVKYKKLKHSKFSGFELWKECLAGNKEAWDEMKKYNVHDVLATEELYNKLIPWSNEVNFNLYNNNSINNCKCGSSKFIKKGFYYTEVSKFQVYKCKVCGAKTRSRINLFSKEKKASIRVPLK